MLRFLTITMSMEWITDSQFPTNSVYPKSRQLLHTLPFCELLTCSFAVKVNTKGAFTEDSPAFQQGPMGE